MHKPMILIFFLLLLIFLHFLFLQEFYFSLQLRGFHKNTTTSVYNSFPLFLDIAHISFPFPLYKQPLTPHYFLIPTEVSSHTSSSTLSALSCPLTLTSFSPPPQSKPHPHPASDHVRQFETDSTGPLPLYSTTLRSLVLILAVAPTPAYTPIPLRHPNLHSHTSQP